MPAELSHAELGRALAAGHAALPELVDRWTPIIQARVLRVLRRRAATLGDRVFQEMEEFVQQVFVTLFENEAAALRSWQPERGLSLDNWIGLLAEQRVLAMLRTRKRNPWTEEPAAAETFERTSAEPSPERETLGRRALGELLDRLQERLSPLGWQVFRLLYLEELGVRETAGRSGLTTTAVYAWRSRLRRLARELGGEEMSKRDPAAHTPLDEPRTGGTT